MQYETFKKVILERLTNDIPDPKNISIQSVQKNNGYVLDGLVILENHCNISPTIYLNYYYEHYENGISFQEIYHQIMLAYQQNKPKQNIDVSFFTDFKNTREKIMFKLINYELNKEQLRDIPHIRFLDLAIVFYILIAVNKDIGNATILIHKSHLDFWKITEQDLYQIATGNTCCTLRPKIQNMDEILRDLSDPAGKSGPCLSGEDDVRMHVLTNQYNLFGAACMLYSGILKSFAERYESDLYILPSSIHEVILIPAKDDSSLSDLSEMVREVNRTQLHEDEVLSDHAYYYSLEEDSIRL